MYRNVDVNLIYSKFIWSNINHGWIPAGTLAQYAGKDNPFAVPIAVLIGIPLYSNAAGVIPLVSELTRTGVSMPLLLP